MFYMGKGKTTAHVFMTGDFQTEKKGVVRIRTLLGQS